MDFVSLHAYFEEDAAGDLGAFLAASTVLDRYIESVIETADAVGAALGSEKRLQISVDEWNVWYLRRFEAQPRRDDWPAAPGLAEDDYSVADAVVVGSLLISLLRHADRVTCACLAQLVNTISPIRAEAGGAAWRQTTFHPFSLTARHARGTVVPLVLDVPTIDAGASGPVPAVDGVATYDAGAGQAAVFLVNRSIDEIVELDLEEPALDGLRVVEQVVLSDDDPHARNTTEDRERVLPRRVATDAAVHGTLRVALPPVSWTMLRLGPRESPPAAATASLP